MTVGELKEALKQYDDNLEVFTKKTDFVGNIGCIHTAKKDTILLTDQVEVREEEDDRA